MLAAALLLALPAAAQEQSSPLDDPAGFWLVAETGPDVNETLASIPLFGANLRARVGNPRAVWDIRRENGALTIEIQPRGIVFKPARFADGQFTGDAVDPANQAQRVKLDARLAEGRLTGKLIFTDFELAIDGRPPESVEALRQAYAMARTKLDEYEGPYALAEIERLRAENIVLIQRIQRVEGELARRPAAAPARTASAPGPAAEAPLVATPRISTRGLVADVVTTRATELRAAADTQSPNVEILPAGRPLVRLGEATVAGWSLVATGGGVVGFVPTAAIGSRPPVTASVARAPREIQINFPAWDPGRTGRRMTVSDPGFVSLVGRVRGDGTLTDLKIEDAQVVFNADGSFTAVVEVPPQGRHVRINASFGQNAVTTLDFDIAVGVRQQ
ncbi:MAG: hypothetical protein C6Y20_08645 [Tagaea sp. CACIAM 22H2]|nr:hypothetical protein [Tagaea sp. CACIAM 22H2]